MKKDKPEKEHRTWPRKVLAVLLLATIAFIGVDGYFNGWKTPKRLWYWNTLELHGQRDTLWRVKAHRDFRLIEVKDVRTIAIPESLLVFDQAYRDSGYYRLYFRYSDTASAQLQKMYQTLRSIDTANTFEKSIDDAKKVYANFQVLLGKPAPLVRDTPSNNPKDTSRKFMQSNLGVQTNDEAMAAVKKILGSPPVLVGVGLGVAISMGVELLHGKAYCAVAKEDVFRVDSISRGAQAGTWEGIPIDILWALGTTRATDTLQVKTTTSQR